jgi:hypothetical protein
MYFDGPSGSVIALVVQFQSSCVLSSDLLNLKIAWETSGLSDSGQNLAKIEVASSSRFRLHISDQNPGKTGVHCF